jgi:hypothetical protein
MKIERQAEKWFDKIVEVFFRLYSLARPQAHTKLAWVVVFCGISVVAGPVWEPYAGAILAYSFGINLPDPSSPWIGVVLVVLGLTYHFASAHLHLSHSKHARKFIDDHDSAIYAELMALIGEESFNAFIENLEADHSYYKLEGQKIFEAQRFLKSTSKRFLTPDLQTKADALRLTLSKLVDFLLSRFFIWPEHQDMSNYRSCLQPWHNEERGSDHDPARQSLYRKWTEELDAFCDAAREAHRQLVIAAHAQLGKAALDA